jgi:hypothetical protein
LTIGLLDIIIRVALVSATTLLFAIIFLAYTRVRNRKMLFISIGFAIFWVHALITIPELFSETFHITLDENQHLLLHFIALIFILLGILKD